jgi:hypothetical protein
MCAGGSVRDAYPKSVSKREPDTASHAFTEPQRYTNADSRTDALANSEPINFSNPETESFADSGSLSTAEGQGEEELRFCQCEYGARSKAFNNRRFVQLCVFPQISLLLNDSTSALTRTHRARFSY